MIITAPMMETNIAYIALGSNLEDREKNLELALEEIEKHAEITKKSKIHESKPVGYKDQGDFLNMVIEISTELTPAELIIRLQEIEHKLGRIREIENGPRTIDLDILFYNNEIINQPHLKIPHPRLHKRSFVLNPLNEISPKLVHPKLNKDIKTLKNELGKNRTTS